MFKLYLIATIACCFVIGRFAPCISKHKWLRRLFYIIGVSGMIWGNVEIIYLMDNAISNKEGIIIFLCYYGYLFILISLLYDWVEYLKKKDEKNKI